MRTNYKKMLAVGMSMAMVASSLSVSTIEVRGDMTVAQMVASNQYNLALGKTITANPSNQEGSEKDLSDGKFTPGGNHAATTFGTKDTYYEIDLGKVYKADTLDKLVVGYKEKNDGDTPVNGYKIQYSANGLNFRTVKTTDGTATKAIAAPNYFEEEDLSGIDGNVRFIRISYPNSYQWGIQATEIAVLDVDGNKEEVQMEPCADAKSVAVRSDDYNSVTYSIEAGENQDGYKYIVSVQSGTTSKVIGNGVDAGVEYTAKGVAGGNYQLKVVACTGDSSSAGIVSETFTVADISELIQSSNNIANNIISPYNPQIVEMKSIYNGHSLTTAQKALDGKLSSGEGADVAMRTGSGAPQSFVINLGEYYTPAEIDKVILAYTNDMTYASNAKVEFSLDGENYTEVGSATGYTFKKESGSACALDYVKLDKVGDYTAKAVRFVKVTLSGGQSAYGYVVNEVAVVANTSTPTIVGSDIPEAADVTVSQSQLETFKYSIVAGENQDEAKYAVYLGGELINNDASAGVEYSVEGIDAGTYEIKVCKKEDGWLSKGIKKSIYVDGYTNYIDKKNNVANGNINGYSPEIVEVSSFYTGHSIETAQKAVDGKFATGEGADVALRTAKGSPQYFVIDLGQYYKPSEMHEVMLEYSNQSTYASKVKVEFSLDREQFTEVGSVSGYAFTLATNKSYGLVRVPLQKLSDYSGEAFRFVKVTLSEGASDWGYVINEAIVMANTSTPTVVESQVAEAADFNLSQKKLEEISYEIIPAEGQENAIYQVLLGTTVINKAAKAGTTYSYSGVAPGTYDVKVCTVEDGWLSKGITKNITVEGYVNRIGSSLNLAYRRYHPDVVATTDHDNSQIGDVEPIGQRITAGVQAVNNGVWTDGGHHTGYLQTRPDTKTVNVDYDLAKDYKPEDIHSIISVYNDADTAATEYEIFFSGDGENYESVYHIQNAPFEQFMVAEIDTSSYTQSTVRYVRYRMMDGKFKLYTDQVDGHPFYEAIGYLLRELAVMGDESLLPEKVTNVSASSDAYNQITVQWTDLEETGCTYGVYIDGTLCARFAEGVQTASLSDVMRGNHTVQVSVFKDEMERLSDGVQVTVQEEPITAPPTTEKPTTVKPEITKPAVTKKPETTTKKATVVKVAQTKVKKIKVAKKKATITLATVKGASGYEIRYSLKKNMKNKKTKKVTKTKVVIKNLKSKKAYFFIVRSFKKIGSKVVYSDWSKPKKSKKIK